jgi:uncharacterized protein
MSEKEQFVREFYAARARRDWQAVRELLATDVVWHELGPEQDYSGVHEGRDEVAALLEKLVRITNGTFELEPVAVVATAEHVAASVRWAAERGGRRVEGNDLAVFRMAGRQIAEAWFFPDGFDAEALDEVFAFGPD